ncbi:MAG: hypothetical protein AABY26_03815 [Nanoarchaeota archaeon]
MNQPESLVKNFSWKFYVGIVLVIVSLIAGGIIKVLLFFYLNRPILWWTLLIVYILTWPILIWGAWWAGKEAADKIKRYFSFRFYHESVREGTRRVAVQARDRTKNLAINARTRTKRFHDRARAGTTKLREQVKSRLGNGESR